MGNQFLVEAIGSLFAPMGASEPAVYFYRKNPTVPVHLEAIFFASRIQSFAASAPVNQDSNTAQIRVTDAPNLSDGDILEFPSKNLSFVICGEPVLNNISEVWQCQLFNRNCELLSVSALNLVGTGTGTVMFDGSGSGTVT